MPTAENAAFGASEIEHRAQLRRAVIASTVGTTIEWYDFLLYGTVTGLVFGKLFFPEIRPAGRRARSLRRVLHRLCRAADRRGHLRPLGRPHRAQGDPDRDPAGDRRRDRRRRPRPDLRQHRHLGRRAADGHPPDPGHRRRRRMGRLGPAGDGMGAHQQEPRLPLGLAAIRRTRRAVPRQLGGAGVQLAVGRPVPGLGLAHPVPDQHRHGRRRAVDPARHSRDPGLPEDPRRGAHRARAGVGGAEAPAEAGRR